jgi:tripartite-type tricarboxylate transporter receptor subunit TctC
MRKLAAISFVIALMSCGIAVHAQTYPSRPIKLVVPFGPGTMTDTLTRIFSNELAQSLGQPVVIVNKGGADGAIGATEVQRSPADGYTFIVASNSPIAVAPLLRKEPPYDPLKDFTPITFLGTSTFFIVVHPSVPANTLNELISHAKANPKKLNYASANTTSLVQSGILAKNAGIEMVHVPYRSETEAVPDLLSGQIHLMIAANTTVVPHVRAGRLRALATTDPERSPVLPDVPSIVEAGQPAFPVGAWIAFLGPASLPPEIVNRVNKALAEIIARPNIREQMLKYGFNSRTSTPEEFAAFLKSQIDHWRRVLKDANIEPN